MVRESSGHRQQALDPTDYSAYNVAAPADSRLPGGGNYIVSGLYDPNSLVAARNVIDLASKYGDAMEHYNGVDLTMNARLQQGVVVSGGVSMGRVETDYCFVTSSPQGTGLPPTQGAVTAAGLLYCDVKPPFQPNVKLLGVYPLPWGGVTFAATFQSIPGPDDHRGEHVHQRTDPTFARAQPRHRRQRDRDRAANRSRGRCTTSACISSIAGIEELQDRTRSPAGATSISTTPPTRASILTINTTYGSSWIRPTSILQGRLVKFGGQLDF